MKRFNWLNELLASTILAAFVISIVQETYDNKITSAIQHSTHDATA